MFERFGIVPAVDVRDGEAVQLVGGQLGTGTRYGDPEVVARRWVDAGARTLHLIDLEGAMEGQRHNADAIETIVDAVDVPVQVGGGIRTEADARDLFDRGVERVILGTAAFDDPDVVDRLAADHPEGVVVSIDTSDDEVLVAGWTEGTGVGPGEAAREFADRGAAGVLYTDIDREGRQEGVDVDRVERIAEYSPVPVIASGGVAGVDDILALRDAGAATVVVGTALYDGEFTLGEAMAAVDEA